MADSPLTGTPRLSTADRCAYVLTASSLIALGATGGLGWLVSGSLGGWPLVMHMLAGPAFIGGLTWTALALAGRCRVDPTCDGPAFATGQRALFWMALLLGLISIVSILLAMFPLLGYEGQEKLYTIHRGSGLGLLAAFVVHLMLLARSGGRR